MKQSLIIVVSVWLLCSLPPFDFAQGAVSASRTASSPMRAAGSNAADISASTSQRALLDQVTA